MISKPSLKALTTFAAAARLESFKAAGELLNVSPSAVSHQIKAVELWLGQALFERSTRQVTLSVAGKRLSADLQKHFLGIDQALERARADVPPRSLHISALPLFANTWLLPRLAQFELSHPGFSITLDTVNSLADLAAGDVDIGIRNTRVRAPGLVHRKLIDVQLVPLCVPELASNISCQELLQLPLIAHAARRNSWQQWLQKQGVHDWPPPRLFAVDTIPGAIAAAAQGAGVMLGLAPFIWEADGIGALHDPVRQPLLAGGQYTLVYRAADKNKADVQTFVDWLLATMRADYYRLLRLPAVGAP